MKSLLVAALLFISVNSMAATLVLKEGSGSGMQSLEMGVNMKMSYSKNSSTSFSGNQADVAVSMKMGGMEGFGGMGMPGMADGMTKQASISFQGSVTVIGQALVEVVTVSQDGTTSDLKLKAAIGRDSKGQLTSIKVTGREFLRNGTNLVNGTLGGAQLEQFRQMPGRMTLDIGDLNCRASGSALACKQNLKIDIAM